MHQPLSHSWHSWCPRYQDANRLVLGKLLYGPMELDPHKLVEHRIATVWKWGNTIINNLNGDIQV